MVETILGKVMVTPKGEWDALTTYSILDMVRYEGSSYVSRKNLNSSPLDDGTSWDINAKKGDKGDKGNTGSIVYPTFNIDPTTGQLEMIINQAYSNDMFTIINGNLILIWDNQ